MTRLRVEQNTITENVTSNVIHKLYETAKAIIDAEEANDVQESQVSLKGNLQVSKAYGDEVDWLTAKFQDLNIYITTSRYISFEDPYEQQYWANSPIGDGIGVTLENLQTITNNVTRQYFGSDTGVSPINENILSQVTSLTSLKYTNIEMFDSWRTYIKQYTPNLKKIAFPASTTNVSRNFWDFPDLEYIDSSLCDNCTEFGITYCPKLEEVHIPPLACNKFYGAFINCGMMKDVFAYGIPDLTTTYVWGLEKCPVFNFWVNDCNYNDWVTFFNNVSWSSKVVLKKFSEYTGDKLIQKWVKPITEP